MPLIDRSSVDLLHPDCRYYLAKQTGPMAVELVDGCHGSPEGVAQAAKLLSRIFGQEGPWLMVELHPVSDVDVPINEDAAATCRALVENHALDEKQGGE